MSDEESFGAAVSEDDLHKLRKMFGPELAARIEEAVAEVPHPDAPIHLLIREDLSGNTHLPYHIGILLDLLGPAGLGGRDREEAIARITVAANEAIVREIDRLAYGA